MCGLNLDPRIIGNCLLPWHVLYFGYPKAYQYKNLTLGDIVEFNVQRSVHLKYIPISNKMQRYAVYFIWKLLCMFRVVSPPIIRSTHNCIYSIWYLSNRYCYLPLSWKRWSWFECGVGIVLICFGSVADARVGTGLRQQPHQNRSIQFPHHIQTSYKSCVSNRKKRDQ